MNREVLLKKGKLFCARIFIALCSFMLVILEAFFSEEKKPAVFQEACEVTGLAFSWHPTWPA